MYPETKHPSHFRAIGLPLEPALLAALDAGLAGAPVFIQSFEVSNLEQLHGECAHPLVQLMSPYGGPWDLHGEGLGYEALTGEAGLARVARYARAIGVHKAMVLDEERGTPTGLVQRAHAAGLAVHVWTLRAENQFLPRQLRRGEDPAALGDLAAEVAAFVAAGVDGMFCDQPGLVREALRAGG